MDAYPDMPAFRSPFVLLAFVSWLLLAVPPSLGQQQSGQTTRFLTRIGATAELDVGYSARFNGYNTYGALLQTQIPVEYDTKVLSVLDLHVGVGLLESDFLEFDYQTSIPRTEFQEQALAYRENQSYGLEKYTWGIDTTPLWLFLLPEDAHWFVKRILSLRFRSIRELAQSNASVTESSLGVSETLSYGDPSSFTSLTENSPYSFKTRYQYRSISLPLLFFVENRGRLNVGVARWRFSRSYAAQVSALDRRQVIFDATNQTNALVAELYLDLNQGALAGFEFDFFYGYGIDSDWSGDNVDVDRLFFPSGDSEVDITNHNFQIKTSYPFRFFQSRSGLDGFLKVGLNANTFTTAFSNVEGTGPSDNDFSKLDWIIKPSVRLSVQY